MERRISATELARRLGDVLGRVRYRGDTFLVESNGAPVARLVPARDGPPGTVREAFAAWQAAGEPDPSFADDLEWIGRADRVPDNP